MHKHVSRTKSLLVLVYSRNQMIELTLVHVLMEAELVVLSNTEDLLKALDVENFKPWEEMLDIFTN